ncbi:MAG: hypothetical protein JXR96_08955 [Deltaproteobacteria bacterium]|nr:hypothetical protein [Deltaproteobacteria bacterium]
MATQKPERRPVSDDDLRAYLQILKQDPNSRVFAPLAEALTARGELDKSRQLCEMGLRANPDFSDGHLAYARVLFFQFDYARALKAVSTALKLAPDSTEAYLVAAEIFLARSQQKPASDACLKALDLEPENPRALELLKKSNLAPGTNPAAAPRAPSFKSAAGTAPSRRRVDLSPPPMTDPFSHLMAGIENEGAQRIESLDQPFQALSSGSNPGPVEDEFDVPTVPRGQPERPRLPPRPRVPEPDGDLLDQVPTDELLAQAPGDDLLAQVPGSVPAAPQGSQGAPAAIPAAGAAAPRAPSARSGVGLSSVDAAQAVIDAYADRAGYEAAHLPEPRPPILARVLALLSVLLLLLGIVAMIAAMMPDRDAARRLGAQAREGIDAGAAGPSLSVTPQEGAAALPEPPAEAIDSQQGEPG